jgi:adenosine deaminase
VLRTPDDIRRLLREAAEDERAEGSGWLEIQVDPSGYAPRFGGLTAMVELALDAAQGAAAATGVGISVIIAANRTKHPLEARTLARLAARYAGRGVTGFGLSSDERRGAAADFAPAFRIAARSGLLAVPHGGELAGPASVRACLDELNADRIGHGVAAAKDHALTKRLAARQTTLEVCPSSNVALGVAAAPADVPLRELLDAGVPVALGADDPLLFGSRLNAQYELARHVHGLSDGQLAELARMSVRASVAPADISSALLAGIDAWIASPELPAAFGAQPAPAPAAREPA